MNEKTCFFIGNWHTPYSIMDELAKVVEKHITEYGVTTFTVGRYGNFDSMVQGVLRDAKKQHDIKIYLLAPYALNQKIETPIDFDGTFYLKVQRKCRFVLQLFKQTDTWYRTLII